MACFLSVYWSAPTNNVAKVEAACHRALAGYRSAGTLVGMHEVFCCSPDHAREVARRLVQPPGLSWWLHDWGQWPRLAWRCATWAVWVALLASALGQ
jgi:hypothetical protein